MDLQCIACRHSLLSTSTSFDCPACGRTFPIQDGIASFSSSNYYYNIIPREPMTEYLSALATARWDEAFYQLQLKLPQKARAIFNNVLAFHRAGWKFLLPRGEHVRALDLGCGWGCISIALARSCGEVVSVDLTRERLRSLREFAAFEGLDNLRFIHGGDGPLPFPDTSFDVVVLNGVLEWVPETSEGDPREIQLRCLTEIARILKPNGVLYVAIENRFAWRYLVRREDHVGLYWSSFLPRRLSDAYSRSVRGQGYRTYTYGMRGYRRLFDEAGIPAVHFFCPLPDYRYPRRITNLEPRVGYPFDDGSLPKWRRRLAYSFSIVASKSPDRKDGLQRLIDALQERLGSGALKCDRYLVQKSEAILFLSGADRRQYVARLPYGERESQRDRNNAAALRLLQKRGGIQGVVIPEILVEDYIGRDYVTVETMVPGVDLRTGYRQSNGEEILTTLTDFLVGFGRAHLRAGVSGTERAAGIWAMADNVSQRLIDRNLREEFSALSRLLISRVERTEFSTVWTHGDFNLGNCLWNTNANKLQALVDWDQMQEDGQAGWDLIQMINSARRCEKRQTGGDAVGDIATSGLTAQENRLWARYWSGLNVPSEVPIVLATYWLKLMNYGFLHSQRHLNYRWIEQNIRPVLPALKRIL